MAVNNARLDKLRIKFSAPCENIHVKTLVAKEMKDELLTGFNKTYSRYSVSLVSSLEVLPINFDQCTLMKDFSPQSIIK